MVTVTNMDTGTTRSSMTNTDGVYRAPLLPLGRYRVSAELQGFKTFEQQGITLSAGQTALINIDLSVGNVSETVTVTSEAPIAEPGKIDLGRTISESEVKNLPLVSRNQPDAHELSARRQYQHPEGSRGAAHAAGVGDPGPRSQGDHQRLRA
jgi:hypothetical protein